MPLPIGHSAIGFATHSLISNDKANFNKWHMAIFIILFSNLPDMDVLFGLILQNNGSAFHRGPTHSILFAFIMGYIASKSSKIWSYIPVVASHGLRTSRLTLSETHTSVPHFFIQKNNLEKTHSSAFFTGMPIYLFICKKRGIQGVTQQSLRWGTGPIC